MHHHTHHNRGCGVANGSTHVVGVVCGALGSVLCCATNTPVVLHIPHNKPPHTPLLCLLCQCSQSTPSTTAAAGWCWWLWHNDRHGVWVNKQNKKSEVAALGVGWLLPSHALAIHKHTKHHPPHNKWCIGVGVATTKQCLHALCGMAMWWVCLTHPTKHVVVPCCGGCTLFTTTTSLARPHTCHLVATLVSHHFKATLPLLCTTVCGPLHPHHTLLLMWLHCSHSCHHLTTSHPFIGVLLMLWWIGWWVGGLVWQAVLLHQHHLLVECVHTHTLGLCGTKHTVEHKW